MADEIPGQNVIRITRDGPSAWRATIGPDSERGVCGFGPGGVSALFNLVWKLARGGWIFDATWRERERKGENADAR